MEVNRTWRTEDINKRSRQHRLMVFDPSIFVVFKQKSIMTSDLQTLVPHRRLKQERPLGSFLDKERREDRRPPTVIKNCKELKVDVTEPEVLYKRDTHRDTGTEVFRENFPVVSYLSRVRVDHTGVEVN